MGRLIPIFLLVLSSFGVPAQAGCVRETFVALVQKLSVRPRWDEAFRKYFEDGDPQGWKKIIEETISEIGGEVSLGGNEGNTHSISLRDGSRVVTKEFPSAGLNEHAKILKQLESWNSQGVGPEILGVSLLPGNRGTEKRLFLVMEDLLATKNNIGRMIVGGNGRDVRRLRNEPEAAKAWVSEQMIQLLDRHPDPHPMNVVYRVTQYDPRSFLPKAGSYYQAGERIYQVFLIDPSGVEGDAEHPLFNGDQEKTHPALLQYHRAWKQNFFKREMGLR